MNTYERYERPLSEPKPMRLPPYPAGQPWLGEYFVAYALIGYRLTYEQAILEPQEEVFI